MKRAKLTNAQREQKESQIQALSVLVDRVNLAHRFGYQYGGDRDLYEALGYKTTIVFGDYMARYARQDIAKAIIDRPVASTWQGPLELIETNDEEKTEFEKQWTKLNREHGLKTKFARVDRLTGIGWYGVLLLGLDDVKKIEDFAEPVKAGKRKLIYVKPLGQGTTSIHKYEEDPRNSRYGLPDIYNIKIEEVGSKSPSEVKVHHTRVIHIVDDTLESEVEGTPRLQPVYNRLMDIEKIVGGDAEMFWRGARPGYQGKVDSEFQMTPTAREDLKDQLDEYEHNLRRFLVNEGVDIQALEQQLADPDNHMKVQIQCISAVTGIPQRILTGSERGELASSEDRGEWLSYVQTRRGEHAEPRIVRPVVDRLVELKILPKPSEDYSIKWADLFAQSEKSRAEIGKARALALRDYTQNPMAEAVVPPNAFMEFFLGLETDQIELINKMRAAEISDEDLARAIAERMEGEQASAGREVYKPDEEEQSEGEEVE